MLVYWLLYIFDIVILSYIVRLKMIKSMLAKVWFFSHLLSTMHLQHHRACTLCTEVSRQRFMCVNDLRELWEIGAYFTTAGRLDRDQLSENDDEPCVASGDWRMRMMCMMLMLRSMLRSVQKLDCLWKERRGWVEQTYENPCEDMTSLWKWV